ncbi:ribosomal L17 family protein, partial [Chlamydia psittaci 02DC14]
MHGQIRTTLERAKKIKSKVDKMITLGKVNTLATRRQAVKYLINVPSKDAKKDIVQ